MRSNLEQLIAELREARALIDSIIPVNSALSGQPDGSIQKYLNVRRRFDYAALVVALYASYEKFVEDIVAAYARVKARGKLYSELPQKLIDKHCRKSTEIVSRGSLGKGRYVGLTDFTVIENLHQCMSNLPNYQLNDVAVVAHENNLRYHETLSLVANLGIVDLCNKVRRTDALTSWFASASSLTGYIESVPLETVLARLEDVVERRNQVTHRGGSPDNILGPDEMRELVDFVEAICQGIFAVILRDYIDCDYIASQKATKLTVKEGPYKNGTVVVIGNPGASTSIGQPILCIAGISRIFCGRVKGIQLDGTPCVSVNDLSINEIGIELDFRIPKSSTLYQIEVADELLWPVADVQGSY